MSTLPRVSLSISIIDNLLSATGVANAISVQNGTSSFESLHGGAVGSDGNFVLVGETPGYWNDSIAGNLSGEAFKMNPQGEVIWNWKVNAVNLQIENVHQQLNDDTVDCCDRTHRTANH